ncbi:MAG TPA: carotenoid biosynthesis protein [Candidatus Limnocylindrales bacterium]
MKGRVLLGIASVLLAVFTYDAVVRLLLSGVVSLPSVPGGLRMLTAVLALFSLFHAWYSLGGRLTLAFFALSATISWVYEQVGVTTGLVFGAYHYTDYLGAKLGDVPLLIPLAWFMMIYPSYVIAGLAVERRPTGTPRGAAALVRLAAISAVVMTVWDLVVDPILSGPDARAWIWENGGPYFGIPIQNYFGWLLTTFTVYVAYRALEQRVAAAPAGPVTARIAVLAVGAYAAMLAAEVLSGVLPAGVAVIGPVVMGVPIATAAVRLRAGIATQAELRRGPGTEPPSEEPSEPQTERRDGAAAST